MVLSDSWWVHGASWYDSVLPNRAFAPVAVPMLHADAGRWTVVSSRQPAVQILLPVTSPNVSLLSKSCCPSSLRRSARCPNPTAAARLLPETPPRPPFPRPPHRRLRRAPHPLPRTPSRFSSLSACPSSSPSGRLAISTALLLRAP